MSKEFPNVCCRCGFCCTVSTCPIGKEFSDKAEFGKKCPFVSFSGDLATCTLFERLADFVGSNNKAALEIQFGFGAGCCIKATAMNTALGVGLSFAELPAEMKKKIAQEAKNKS